MKKESAPDNAKDAVTPFALAISDVKETTKLLADWGAILTISQDSLLKIIYADEIPADVKHIERYIDTLAAVDGRCLLSAFAIVTSKVPTSERDIAEIFMLSYDSTAGIEDWDCSMGETFGEAMWFTVERTDEYHFIDGCKVLQIREHLNYGESEGSKTVLHVYTNDDNSLHEILTVNERELLEADDDDSTSTRTVVSEHIEFLPGSTQGFKNLKVIVSDAGYVEPVKIRERRFEFNIENKTYTEMDN